MGLESRLKRIEAKSRGALPCPTCNYPPDMGGIIVLEEGKEPAAKLDPNERCSGCGRRLWTVIRVVYSEAGEG